jgi:hypothetical protein
VAVRKIRALLISHVPHADRDGDENDQDNSCQSDHERSHRTIQQSHDLKSGESKARGAIDAGLPPVVLSPWMNPRLVT